jgi:RHS repeat-associated protein
MAQLQCLCRNEETWTQMYLMGYRCKHFEELYFSALSEVEGYHSDYLGHTEYITDAGGFPYQYFYYSPYGQCRGLAQASLWRSGALARTGLACGDEESLVTQHANSGSFSTPFRFNAKEFDAETGNYYYGARYYNPRWSVWLSVDPLAHKYPNMTSYVFTGNNPVMLVDPDGMRIVLPNTQQANKVAGDLNRIYQNKYGISDAFIVVTREITITKANPKYKFWNPFTWGNPETISIVVKRTYIEANDNFDWNTDKYTKQMKQIIDADTDILIRVIPDNGDEARKMSHGSKRGLLYDWGGGATKSSNSIVISDALPETSTSNVRQNKANWTIGGVVMHELLYHIHPEGKNENSVNDLRNYYNQRTGKEHGSGSQQNRRVGDD